MNQCMSTTYNKKALFLFHVTVCTICGLQYLHFPVLIATFIVVVSQAGKSNLVTAMQL